MNLETLLEEDVTGKRTGMGAMARRAFAALRAARAHFTVIGAIALGLRARRRFTEDIDLLVQPTKWKAAIQAMKKAGFREHPEWKPDDILARFIDRRTGLGVDLLFGVGDPEESARTTGETMTVFRSRVRVARSDYLLWLYLLSDRPQHHEDALSILRAGTVDLSKLREKLVIARERESMLRLKDWVAEAKNPEPELRWRERERKKRTRSSEEE